MALQERLDFIDNEIHKLQIFCTKSGYSARQVETFAKPFFDQEVSQQQRHHTATSIWASGKAWKRRAVSLAAVIISASLLFRFDPAYRLACAMSKQGAIQILPLWDWTQLYYTRCWLSNPFYKQESGLQIADCEICEGILELERVKDLNGLTLVKKFLHRDQPIIVEDGIKDWGRMANLSFEALVELYNKHPILNKYRSCRFASNIKMPNSDHIDLLTLWSSNQTDRFYAQWKNCNVLAAKAFRNMYKRPYFLPSTVALASINGVFLSSSYTGRIYKPVEMNEPMMIFIQIKGETYLRLEPWEPCHEHCHTFHERLSQGQILVTTERMWKVDYLPSKQPENIAISLGGSFA